MSKIRIYSKKSFDIGPGAQRGNPEIESFLTVPGSFQDMPDKYYNDPTFQAAIKCGDIVIMENKPTVSNVNVDTSNFEDEPVNKVDTDKLIKEFYEKVKTMNADEVQAECSKYDAEFVKEDKLKENKKRLMEAYKLSLN